MCSYNLDLPNYWLLFYAKNYINVDNIRDLGVTQNRKLSFYKYIEKNNDKANRSLNVIIGNSIIIKFLCLKAYKNTYCSYIANLESLI